MWTKYNFWGQWHFSRRKDLQVVYDDFGGQQSQRNRFFANFVVMCFLNNLSTDWCCCTKKQNFMSWSFHLCPRGPRVNSPFAHGLLTRSSALRAMGLIVTYLHHAADRPQDNLSSIWLSSEFLVEASTSIKFWEIWDLLHEFSSNLCCSKPEFQPSPPLAKSPET